MEMQDGLSLTLGGTTLALVAKEIFAWLRARRQKTEITPTPLPVDKLDKYVTRGEFNKHVDDNARDHENIFSRLNANDKLCDGKWSEAHGERWSTDTWPAVVDFDFGTKLTFRKIAVIPMQKRNYAFTMEFSDDGVAWRKVIDHTKPHRNEIIFNFDMDSRDKAVVLLVGLIAMLYWYLLFYRKKKKYANIGEDFEILGYEDDDGSI